MAVLASMAAGAACATLADEPCAGQARCGGAGEVNRAGSDLGVPAGTVKSVEGLAAIASAGTFACWCSAAQAYRPFDGTDAAVVETGEVEIELGPVGYLRAGADRTLSVPNLGLKPPTFWSRADPVTMARQVDGAGEMPPLQAPWITLASAFPAILSSHGLRFAHDSPLEEAVMSEPVSGERPIPW